MVMGGESDPRDENPVDIEDFPLQEQQREIEQRAALRAAQHDPNNTGNQPGGSSGTEPEQPTPITKQPVVPQQPVESIAPVEPVVLLSTLAQTESETTMRASLSSVQDSLINLQLNGNNKEFMQAWDTYKSEYLTQKSQLTAAGVQDKYQPMVVLYNLIKSIKPVEPNAIQNSLNTALQSAPLTIQMFGTSSMRTEVINSNMRNGITMFINAVHQIDALTTLLNEQADLLTAQVNAGQIMQQSYQLYANLWNARYKELQVAMKPTVNLNSQLSNFAKQVNAMAFIDVSGNSVTTDNIQAQIRYVQQLSGVYNRYLLCFAKVGLKDPLAGTQDQLTFGLFDFVNNFNIDQEIQHQIAIAAVREKAQPFFRKLINAILSLRYPSLSVSHTWKVLQEQQLSYDQQNVFEVYQLTKSELPLAPDAISIAGHIEENFLANNALANFPTKTLGIDDLKNLFQFDEDTQKVDQTLLNAFFSPIDMSQEEKNTYLLERGGAFLLKQKYMQQFIQYRLFGLTDKTGSINYIWRKKRFVDNTNPLWAGLSDQKRIAFQTFINQNSYWDLDTNRFVLNLNPDAIADESERFTFLNTWMDLTSAIQAWAKSDVIRMNELMRQDYSTEILSKNDIELLRSYLLLEKALHGANAPTSQNGVLTIDDVVYLCFPLTDWAIRQALSIPAPLNLSTFIGYAQQTNKFYNGTNSIQSQFMSMQGVYVVNLTSSMQQQINSGNAGAGSYTTVLPSSYQQYPGAILAVLNDPNAAAGGGGGGHGHFDLNLRLKLDTSQKCYNAKGQEIECPDSEKQPISTRTNISLSIPVG